MKKTLFNMLKVCVPLILIFVGIATISLEGDSTMYQGLPEEDKMLYRFINRQGQILGKKYQMIQSSNGLGGMDKVELMCISFDKYGAPINEKEARSLVIHCVEDFLEAVNSDEQLRPLLKDYPFTAQNLKLNIFSLDKDQSLHIFPNIAVASSSEGKVRFFTKEAPDVYGYYTEKYETYEEAIAILKEEGKADCSK
jgi:hypothetical protein